MQLAGGSDIPIRALGHRDTETEKKEKALERMSMPSSSKTPSSKPADSSSSKKGSEIAASSPHRISEPLPQRTSPLSLEESAPQAEFHSQEATALRPSPSAQHGTQEESDLRNEMQQNSLQDTVDLSSNSNRLEELDPAQPAEKSNSSDSAPAGQTVSEHLKAAEQVDTPMSDAGEVLDESASYFAAARKAVDTLLQSSNQQQALLGLNTLLSILKVTFFYCSC